MSVYNPNIPQPTDFLANSQQDLLNNFGQLDTSFGINHYDFSDGTVDNGKHKFLQLPEEAAAPVTAANEGAVYTKEFGTGAQTPETNLFYSAEDSGGGGGFEYLLTRTVAAQTATFGNDSNYQVAAGATPSLNGGWTFLPGGLIFQWGKSNNPFSGTHLFTFPFEFPNAVWNIQVTALKASSATNIDFAVVPGFTKATFSVIKQITGNSLQFMWTAIGN